jgi:hypothetical protein
VKSGDGEQQVLLQRGQVHLASLITSSI